MMKKKTDEVDDDDKKCQEIEKKFQVELAKFKVSYKEMQEKVVAHIEAAEKELKAAVKVTEKYGLPYHFPLSPLSQSYVPKSCNKKWTKMLSVMEEMGEYGIEPVSGLNLDADIALESLMSEDRGNEGWEHSAVCW